MPTGDPGLAWSVYASPAAGSKFGIAPKDLPTVASLPADRTWAGGLVLEATHPFLVDMAVFDKLGVFVSRVQLDAGPGQFEKLPAGTVAGMRQAVMVWNGKTDRAFRRRPALISSYGA